MDEENFDGILRVVMKSSFAVFALMLAARFFSYLLNILIAKSFSEEVYGSFALIWSVVTLSTSILLLGIPLGAARFIAYYRGRGEPANVADTLKTGLHLVIVLTVAASIAVYLVIGGLRGFFSVDHATVLSTVALFASFSAFTYFYHVITGFRKPQISNALELIVKTLAVVLSFWWILKGGSLFSVLFALAISYIVATLFGAAYCMRRYDFGGRFRQSIVKLITVFGLSVMVSNITYAILTWSDVFMIRMFRGLSEVGVYYAASVMAAAGLLFFGSVTSIFTPLITEYFGSRRLDRIGALSSYLLESFVVLFTPIFLVFIAFPKEILVLFFKSEYASGALAFQILTVSMFLFGLMQIFRVILQAAGKPQLEVKAVVLATVVNITLNLIVIKPYGIVGAASTTLFANIILIGAAYYYSTGIVRLHYSKRRMLKVVFACIISLAVALIVRGVIEGQTLSLIASSVSLLLAYIAVLYALKSFRAEDVAAVDAIFRKAGLPNGVKESIVKCMKRSVAHYGKSAG
jgi:O-antigen/teichoic acid export membrane protein